MKVAHEGAVHTGVPKGENALLYAWSLSIYIYIFFISETVDYKFINMVRMLCC